MQAKKPTRFKHFLKPGSNIRQPGACSCKTPLNPKRFPYLQASLLVPWTPIHRRGWHQWFPSRATSSSLQVSAVLRSAWTHRGFDLAFFFFFFFQSTVFRGKKPPRQSSWMKIRGHAIVLSQSTLCIRECSFSHATKNTLSKHNHRSYVLTQEKNNKGVWKDPALAGWLLRLEGERDSAEQNG